MAVTMDPQRPTAKFFTQEKQVEFAATQVTLSLSDGFCLNIPRSKIQSVLDKYPQILKTEEAADSAEVEKAAASAPSEIDQDAKGVVIKLNITSLQLMILRNYCKRESNLEAFKPLFVKIDKQALLDPNLWEVIAELFSKIREDIPCFADNFFCEIWFSSLEDAEAVVRNYTENCETQEEEPPFSSLPVYVQHAKMALEMEALCGSREMANSVLMGCKDVATGTHEVELRMLELGVKFIQGGPLSKIYEKQQEREERALADFSREEARLKGFLVPSSVRNYHKDYPISGFHCMTRNWVESSIKTHDEGLLLALTCLGFNVHDMSSEVLKALFEDRMLMYYDFCYDKDANDFVLHSQVCKEGAKVKLSKLLRESSMNSVASLETAIRKSFTTALKQKSDQVKTALAHLATEGEDVTPSKKAFVSRLKQNTPLSTYEELMLERVALRENNISIGGSLVEVDLVGGRNEPYSFDMSVCLDFLLAQKSFSFSVDMDEDTLELTVLDLSKGENGGRSLRSLLDDLNAISNREVEPSQDSQAEKSKDARELLDNAGAYSAL